MARVIIIQGPKHKIQDIDGDVTTVGRSHDNTIPVDDENVSRRHCKIEKVENRFRLTDCESFNGTYVNNLMVEETFLQSGDKIQVGSTVIYFVGSDEDIKAAAPAAGAAAKAPKTEQVPAPKAPEFDLNATARFGGALDKVSGPLESEQLNRRIENLEALFEINKVLNSELDLDKLLGLIMDKAIQLMGAERGFLILRDEEGGGIHFAVARGMGNEVVDKPEFNVSKSIINKVLEEGKPVLSTNAQSDYGQFLSIVDLSLRALLCVPLRVKERVIGTLYLDSRLATAPFTQESVNLLQAFGDQAAIAIENARLLKAVREKERMERELQIASQIQQELLPKTIPPTTGLLLHGEMRTAKEVGGDYFDFVAAPEPGSAFICLGDVSGKGVPAGLIMVMARSILHTSTQGASRGTKQVMVELNKILKKDLRQDMFMSIILFKWWGETQKLTYTGAGFEKPLIYRGANKSVEVLNAGGIVCGVMADVTNILKEGELPLASGDSVVLYTDGVTEAMNAANDEFTLDRLKKSVAAHGHLPPKELIAAVVEDVGVFVAGAEQHDDITMVVMRRQ